MPSLVSVAWLSSRLHTSALALLDCSWYLPGSGRNPDAEFRAAHIPGAVRYDLDLASDAASGLPHMLPTPTQFASLARSLGIRRDDRVVCYDGSGVNLSAARVWWMFRVFGHGSAEGGGGR